MTRRQRTWFYRSLRIGDGCWPWGGSTDIHGYGKFGNRGAHRMSYEHFVGDVPEGKQLDHLCRNRNCTNPWHMEPVTVGENLRRGHRARGVAGGRENAVRRAAARTRYDKRKALGLPGPQPGESREDYHTRIDNAFHSVHADLWDAREGK